MNEHLSTASFQGKIGRTREESEPWWPPACKAAPGSPNVVIVYLDDMGYADLGCFGSEIATPHIDAIARRGLRFNHYTTHPICSPARAALLTGRNAHAVSSGWLSHNNAGFPGYSGDIPLESPTIAEAFRDAGYATIAIGKWHNSHDASTPNATWPSQRGFQRFYGFLEGETSYFHPARILYNNMVAPIDAYPDGYYATDDWTDHALEYIKTVRNDDPQQPFFLYLAPNAMHGPLQAKPADIAKYRGRYSEGWDVLRAQRLQRQKAIGLAPANATLSPRNPSVPAWDRVPDEQQQLFARYMETYAALLDCVDQNVGRLTALLQNMGELDNTIIVLSSDNGGTSGGGAEGVVYFNRHFAGLPAHSVADDLARQHLIGTAEAAAMYPMGWAQVSNTPFPSYKTYTAGGGRRVSFLISWPKRVADGGAVRKQFVHVTDVMPTLLELAGVPFPAQSHDKPSLPMQGTSFARTLVEAEAPAARTEQYYECWSNRAYYRDGWVAVSLQKRGEPIDFLNWTLHEQATDFSESVNLADVHPQRLRELVEAFDRAAHDNLVYPLDNRKPIQKFNQLPPHLVPPRESMRRFYPGTQTIHRSKIVPLISDRNFKVRVRLHHKVQDQGVLFSVGEVFAGMVLYVESGALHLTYNGFGDFNRVGPVAIAPGAQQVMLEYEALGARAGRGRIVVEATDAASPWQALSPTLMAGMHEGLDIGIDRRAPVDAALYERHRNFPYTGEIVDFSIESGAFAPDSVFAKASQECHS